MKAVSILAAVLCVGLLSNAFPALALDRDATTIAIMQWRQQKATCEVGKDGSMVGLIKCRYGTVPEQLARAGFFTADLMAEARREQIEVAQRCDAGTISDDACVRGLSEIDQAYADAAYARNDAAKQDLADKREFLNRLRDILSRAQQNSVPAYTPPPAYSPPRQSQTTCQIVGTELQCGTTNY